MGAALATPPKGATKPLQQKMRVKKIANLFPLSLDAGATLWLLRHPLAMKTFSGASSAKMIFWPGGLGTPDGRPVAAWEAEGVLPINCGGGTYDHHPHGKHEGDCTFTLMLKALGLKNDPRFKLMMEYIYWDDTRAFARVDHPELALPQKQETKFALSRMFKDMQGRVKFTGDDAVDQESMRKVAQTALYWLYVQLDLHLHLQEDFFTEGAKAFNAATKRKVTDKAGNVWQIVLGATDCDTFGAYARSPYSDFSPSLVVQFRPDGHAQIMGTNGTNLDMTDLVQKIRLEEFRRHGKVIGAISMDKFREEGTIEEVPEWFFMPGKSADGSSMVLSGSHRHRAVPISLIPPDVQERILVEWLSGNPLGK